MTGLFASSCHWYAPTTWTDVRNVQLGTNLSHNASIDITLPTSIAGENVTATAINIESASANANASSVLASPEPSESDAWTALLGSAPARWLPFPRRSSNPEGASQSAPASSIDDSKKTNLDGAEDESRSPFKVVLRNATSASDEDAASDSNETNSNSTQRWTRTRRRSWCWLDFGQTGGKGIWEPVARPCSVPADSAPASESGTEAGDGSTDTHTDAQSESDVDVDVHANANANAEPKSENPSDEPAPPQKANTKGGRGFLPFLPRKFFLGQGGIGVMIDLGLGTVHETVAQRASCGKASALAVEASSREDADADADAGAEAEGAPEDDTESADAGAAAAETAGGDATSNETEQLQIIEFVS